MRAYTGYSNRVTHQSQPIPGQEAEMAQNNAGGFTFVLDNWAQLDRFLILGSEGGTYYVDERKLTSDNAKNVLACIKQDGVRVVNRIVEISDAGRAPKNDPALFALAMVAGHGNESARKAAYEALSKVARIGTHLFHFAAYVEQFRGWGRGLRNAIANWYLDKDANKLAYDVTKYAQRDGWSHRDLLRLAHPKAKSEDMNSLFRYIVKGNLDDSVSKYIEAVEKIKSTKEASIAAKLIVDYNLPREVVPTELLNESVVWDALMQKMPMTAMIRNLATMTRIGVLSDSSEWTKVIADRLGDMEALRKARVHPISILMALKTYADGRGVRGGNTWEPLGRIVDALDAAFYLSFGIIEPTGKRYVLGLDVSGSMSGGMVGGILGLSPRAATSAMAMITARTESEYHLMAFSTGFTRLPITPRQRLDDIVKYTDGLPFDGTDCSLPMLWALKNKVKADAFVVYTDNETWAGQMHPMQALRKYRDAMGIPAKLIVAGVTATEFTIADPSDAGSLDVVGFDASVPNIINDFVRN